MAGSLAVCLALALGAPTARADGPRVRVELLAGGVHLDYVEHGPTGAFLDGERGWVPSLSASVEVAAARGFLRAVAGASQGDLGYDGRVQSSSADLDGLPARTTSGAGFLLGEVQLGAWIDRARSLALYLGGGGRRWERDIRSATVTSRSGVPVRVAGLAEEYRWFELQAGLRWAVARWSRGELEVDAAVVRTVSPAMSVAWGGTDVTLELGARTGWRAALALRRAVGERTFVSLAGSAEGYGFGESALDARARILEPASETRSFAVRAGAGAWF